MSVQVMVPQTGSTQLCCRGLGAEFRRCTSRFEYYKVIQFFFSSLFV